MSQTLIILRLSALGDLVLTSAFMKALREENPNSRILFVTQKNFGEMVSKFFPGKPIVITPENEISGLPAWFQEGRKLAEALKGENVLLYDLHGVGKSLAFSMGLRSKLWTRLEVKRVEKDRFLRKLSLVVAKDLSAPTHVFDKQLRLIGKKAFPELQNSQGAMRDILLAPEAKHWKKVWPYWEELLKKLQGHSVTLVAQDLAPFQKLIAENLQLKVVSRLSPVDLPSLAAEHQLTVCGNSAWLHIAEAVGRPVVALAGPIVPGFGFSPWRKESVELSVDLSCRPCTLHGDGTCHREGSDYHACMKLISADRVAQEVKKLLKSSLKTSPKDLI